MSKHAMDKPGPMALSTLELRSRPLMEKKYECWFEWNKINRSIYMYIVITHHNSNSDNVAELCLINGHPRQWLNHKQVLDSLGYPHGKRKVRITVVLFKISVLGARLT